MAKKIARGYITNQKRVHFEAAAIANGYTPEEVAKESGARYPKPWFMIKPSIYAKVIWDRGWLAYGYCVFTLILCVGVIFRFSFVTGGSALLASALCYFSAGTIIGSFRARRDFNYGLKKLAGIAVIAVALSAGGIALMVWSGFGVTLFGVSLKGSTWCFVGILIAALTTTREVAMGTHT